MDATVTQIASVVVAELRAAGYMESTIGQYDKTIKALTSFVDERGGAYSPSLGGAFESMTVSPRTGRFSAQRRFDYPRLVSVFGLLCADRPGGALIAKRGGGDARPESGEFTALAAAWEADMADRALAPATRDAYGRVARGYLVFLESRGVRCLGDADGASILGFLEALSSRWARSSLFWVVVRPGTTAVIRHRRGPSHYFRSTFGLYLVVDRGRHDLFSLWRCCCRRRSCRIRWDRPGRPPGVAAVGGVRPVLAPFGCRAAVAAACRAARPSDAASAVDQSCRGVCRSCAPRGRSRRTRLFHARGFAVRPG